MSAFQTVTYGKWILAGEHAVLRGIPALAFPLLSRELRLEFIPGAHDLKVEFVGARGADFRSLFDAVLERACRRLGQEVPRQGTFRLSSDLLVGAGLGASAALCGAVARWCAHEGWVAENEIYELACRLEDLFHGESSGVDIAVSLSGTGVHFVRGGDRHAVRPAWRPKLFLSYCGQRGMTAECVNKVKQGFVTDAARAERLDQQMGEAVGIAERALLGDAPEGQRLLARALDLADECFARWGLSDGLLGEHLRALKRAGAVAVKPTGSGGGGFALSLWSEDPPAELGLIATEGAVNR